MTYQDRHTTRDHKSNKLQNALRLTLLALLLVVDVVYSAAYAQPSQAVTKGSGVVTYVVDGDTMNIRPDSRETWSNLHNQAKNAQPNSSRSADIDRVFDRRDMTFRTRIGNIDTPESVHPDRSRNLQIGTNASDYARKLIDGKRVGFACWDIGYFLRPICSVWTESPSSDFATVMIKAGYSVYTTKYGEHPFRHDHYQALTPGRP